MDRWAGKIALVTGAGSGIGAAATEKLSKAGLKVFGVDLFVEKVNDLKSKVGAVTGEIIPIFCNVKNEEDVARIFKIVKNKFGKINILVNAAGIGRYGLISDGNTNLFKEIFDVNVLGTLQCTAQALKMMKESGVEDGHIIFINSTAGHYVPSISCERFNVYTASKHAITALTESVRQELVYLKTRIRVTSISPGKVKSNFFKNFANGSNKKIENISDENLKEAPGLEPEDVADSILFALSAPPHVQVHEITIKPVGEKPGF